jgi:hypothetical protein
MEIAGMSWRGKTFIFDRVASLAAITIVAAGSVGVANAGTETAESQSAAPAVPAQKEPSVVPAPDHVAAETVATRDVTATGDAAAAPSDGKPALRASGRVRVGGSLQHRVDVLSRALQLDARQRTELIAILESQRQAVSKIWSDPKLLPSERTPATRALQERTANQIRAILSEEQKKLYNPPKPEGAETPPPDVEEWMRKQTQTGQH